MRQKYHDAMAGVSQLGHPSLFVTFTCNPNWAEIAEVCTTLNVDATKLSSFEVRVFNLKLNALLDDILQKDVFGRVVCYMHVVEFQKRGLPHTHILLVLKREDRPSSADDYDKFVCAELPGEDEVEL